MVSDRIKINDHIGDVVRRTTAVPQGPSAALSSCGRLTSASHSRAAPCAPPSGGLLQMKGPALSGPPLFRIDQVDQVTHIFHTHDFTQFEFDPEGLPFHLAD